MSATRDVFTALLGSSRGSGRPDPRDASDACDAFIGGYALSTPDLCVLAVDVPPRRPPSMFGLSSAPETKPQRICFLVDSAGELQGMRFLIADTEHVQLTVRDNEVGQLLCPPPAGYAVGTLHSPSEHNLLLHCSLMPKARDALVAAGLCEHEMTLDLVAELLTRQQWEYLRALAKAPGTDMYEVGVGIWRWARVQRRSGSREGVDRVVASLLQLGLINPSARPLLRLSDDGVSIVTRPH